jgi:hypothetical protein
MANYTKCIAGVGNVEMSDAQHAARVAEESEWESKKSERAFGALRSERNNKLAETDYFALSDVTMSDEMALYRDQLRKLPNGLNDETVLNFTWPTKP